MKISTAYRLLMFANKRYIARTYGTDFYRRFRLVADGKLAELAPRVPDIGKSVFAMNYAFIVAYVPFVHAFEQFDETRSTAGELIWTINENLFDMVPAPLWKMMGKRAFGRGRQAASAGEGLRDEASRGLGVRRDLKVEPLRGLDRGEVQPVQVAPPNGGANEGERRTDGHSLGDHVGRQSMGVGREGGLSPEHLPVEPRRPVAALHPERHAQDCPDGLEDVDGETSGVLAKVRTVLPVAPVQTEDSRIGRGDEVCHRKAGAEGFRGVRFLASGGLEQGGEGDPVELGEGEEDGHRGHPPSVLHPGEVSGIDAGLREDAGTRQPCGQAGGPQATGQRRLRRNGKERLGLGDIPTAHDGLLRGSGLDQVVLSNRRASLSLAQAPGNRTRPNGRPRRTDGRERS
jgi:hypothetical protein